VNQLITINYAKNNWHLLSFSISSRDIHNSNSFSPIITIKLYNMKNKNKNNLGRMCKILLNFTLDRKDTFHLLFQ